MAEPTDNQSSQPNQDAWTWRQVAGIVFVVGLLAVGLFWPQLMEWWQGPPASGPQAVLQAGPTVTATQGTLRPTAPLPATATATFTPTPTPTASPTQEFVMDVKRRGPYVGPCSYSPEDQCVAYFWDVAVQGGQLSNTDTFDSLVRLRVLPKGEWKVWEWFMDDRALKGSEIPLDYTPNRVGEMIVRWLTDGGTTKVQHVLQFPVPTSAITPTPSPTVTPTPSPTAPSPTPTATPTPGE